MGELSATFAESRSRSLLPLSHLSALSLSACKSPEGSGGPCASCPLMTRLARPPDWSILALRSTQHSDEAPVGQRNVYGLIYILINL